MKKTKEEKQKERLAWVLREWDCQNLNQAMKEAEKDKVLHRILRECGVLFPKNQ